MFTPEEDLESNGQRLCGYHSLADDKTKQIVSDLLNDKQLIPPLMPESWEGNKKMVDRYKNLTSVINAYPEWWNLWKDEIVLKDDGIWFMEGGFILSLNDFNTNDLEALKNLDAKGASMEELLKVFEFIESIGDNYQSKKALRIFLGINTDVLYISSSEELGTNTKLHLHFRNGKIYGEDRELSNLMCYARNIRFVTR
nr:hypothetical protein [Candidatus Gracilibacteria bacterium]